MIALGGSIGTGIFLASGYSIALGGPGGAMIGYLLISIIVYFLMTSLGELSVYRPSSGSLCDYGYEYVSESFGFAMGYNYWLSWAITIAAEISAASLTMAYWFPHIHSLYFSILFFSIIVLFNIFSVRLYGELEYMMSFIKVAVIIVFIVLGFCVIFSKPDTVVHNFTIGDAPFHNGMMGFISVFLFAGYAFQGTELIGVASGEVKEPEKAIPRAVKMVFWRISLFYILSVFVVSALLPYSDPRLLNQNNVLTSPYTLLFSSYLGRYAGDCINFIILIALLSAANASLYSSSRVLWFLAQRNKKSSPIAKLSNQGVPTLALYITAFIGALAFMSSFIKNGQLFTILVTIASISCFVAWWGIAIIHYQFRTKYLKNKTDKLLYKAKFYPYSQLIAVSVISLIVIAQFITFDSSMSFLDKLAVYLGTLPFFVLYAWHKLFLNKKVNKNNKI
jgi:lysine-specific permease